VVCSVNICILLKTVLGNVITNCTKDGPNRIKCRKHLPRIEDVVMELVTIMKYAKRSHLVEKAVIENVVPPNTLVQIGEDGELKNTTVDLHQLTFLLTRNPTLITVTLTERKTVFAMRFCKVGDCFMFFV